MYRDDEAFGSVGSLQDAQRGAQGFLLNSEVTEMPKGKFNTRCSVSPPPLLRFCFYLLRNFLLLKVLRVRGLPVRTECLKTMCERLAYPNVFSHLPSQLTRKDQDESTEANP